MAGWPVPRQNHIGLKAIDFALCLPLTLDPIFPLPRWLLRLLLVSLRSVREVALENLASATRSRSSIGNAYGRGCELRIVVGSGAGAVAPRDLRISVSSPRHITRSVRISRITRSCTLHDKGYGAGRDMAAPQESG